MQATEVSRDTQEFQNIQVRLTPQFATITINRPKVLNALNHDTLAELHGAIDELATDATIRAVIITGAGDKAFVAGADISELGALDTAEQGYEHSRYSHEFLIKLQALDKPVIMAVNGYALGGGCELAMAGDIILASDSARFGQPEVGLGIIPGFGGTQRLPRLVGRTRALELLLTGDHITAQQALAIGLVNRVVPHADLLREAEKLATRIAQMAPLAVALTKRAVYAGLDMTLRAGNDAEMAYFGLAIGTADRKEGTAAFLEKRAPHWEGK
jgi:enoyl-CoA hydratase